MSGLVRRSGVMGAAFAMVLSLVAPAALAQHEGHAAPPADPHAEHDMPDADPHAGHDMPDVDTHAGHDMPDPDPHAGHDMPDADPHAGHDMPDADPHAGHGMPDPDPHAGHDVPPREPVPPITAADLAAAFPPDVDGHTVHDDAVHTYLLFDHLETSDAPGSDAAWEVLAWHGTDLNRLWMRSGGESHDGRIESANAELFYGRMVATWWDALVGVRHDAGEGPSRTYLAAGVMGQAPYKFEVSATAYLGKGGQAGLGVEAEYDTLLTNRWILQWLLEVEAWRRDDAAVGIGAGLSTMEAGLRLRYERVRRFAPYIGIARERAFGATAGLRRQHGDTNDDTRIVAGVRFWF